MTGPSRNRAALLLLASVAACTAAALSIGFAYPTPVANPALGADWQCLRSVGIVTTCHRISHIAPAAHHLLVHPVDIRGV